MKNLKDYLIKEGFNKNEHLALREEFEDIVGSYWDQFIKFLLPKCKQLEKWCEEEGYGEESVISYLEAEKNISIEDIAEKIKCDIDKLDEFFSECDKDLFFTLTEFIAYNKTV